MHKPACSCFQSFPLKFLKQNNCRNLERELEIYNTARLYIIIMISLLKQSLRALEMRNRHFIGRERLQSELIYLCIEVLFLKLKTLLEVTRPD